MAKAKPGKSPKEKADEVATRLETPVDRVPVVDPSELLSTGCTVLNMALSGTPTGAVQKGTFVYFVGESGSSKTWLTFCLFAEAALNERFDAYDFVFDNAENGALFDVSQYFGDAVRNRLRPPSKKATGSATVQEFYYHVEAAVREGPCIYVLDSMDALQDDADAERFAAEVKLFETGEGRVPGSMGMAKAKTNSKNIARIANTTLRSNGSILAVISQTRDALNSPIPGQKTRSGGRALRFYAHQEVWTKVTGVLKKTYKGKDREYGSKIQADVQKNRLTGWEGKVPVIDFVKGHGVDDVGTSVKYLIDEGHWGGDATTVEAPEFGHKGKIEALVAKIQDTNQERMLIDLVAATWREIAAAVRPVRKPRY